MKKIPIYLTIFLLTTGFFKSNLEKCADYNFRLSNSLPTAEYVEEIKPSAIYNKEYAEYERKLKRQKLRDKRKIAEWDRLKRLPFCRSSDYYETEKIRKKYCQKPSDNPSKFTLDFGPTPPSLTTTVVKRVYTKNEIERNYKKFLRQSLKTKLRLADESRSGAKYLAEYNKCVIIEKNNPQLFKDKYS